MGRFLPQEGQKSDEGHEQRQNLRRATETNKEGSVGFIHTLAEGEGTSCNAIGGCKLKIFVKEGDVARLE